MREHILQAVTETLGLSIGQVHVRPVSGGSIARSFRLEDSRRRLFVKVLGADEADILDAECDGLARLREAGAIRVPVVAGQGRVDDSAWLALEWLEMRRPDAECFARMGVALGRLHENQSDRYGLGIDNYLGRTPQLNTPSDIWSDFFLDCRLVPQLQRLAEDHPEFEADAVRGLAAAWREAARNHQPEPSLLHGDLWSGNVAMLPDGRPLIFDPAVHYGDRECDLAMADLFGGFHPAFFNAYQGTRPLEPAWRERRRFYQLYHMLNHANLFGGHYLDICRKLIDDQVKA